MNKLFSIIALLLLFFASTTSQTLQVKDSGVELSKEAQKAAKNGALSYMGTYLNAEQTEMYSFYMYQPKKSPLMMDVGVFDNSGNLKEMRTEEFSAANLAKYQLEPSDELVSEDGGSLAGKKVGYFKRPVLAGKPTLVMGQFKNRYTNGLWTGYEFEEEESTKIEPKFWPFFTVPLSGDQTKNDSYKLAKVNKWSRLLQGQRTYLGLDELVVIGGQKAEMKDGEARIFYVGIFNMATQKWESSQDIDMGAEILPGLWTYHQDDDGNVHCLVGTKNGFYVLQFARDGSFLHNVKLSIPVKGNATAEDFTFYTGDNTLYVASAYYAKNTTGGEPGIGISKVQNGKETAYFSADNAQLNNAMVAVPKSKGKFNKIKFVTLDRFVELPDGFMVFFTPRSSNDVSNYAAHFSSNGDLAACYQATGIPFEVTVRSYGRVGNQPPILAIKDNKIYWLMRTILDGMQQGVYFETEREDVGYATKVTTTTMRNDDIYVQGSIAVIDLNKKTISNQIMPEEALIGVNPMRILPNGNIILNAIDLKKGEYKNLFMSLK
jgi:hypothetical protein